MCTNNKRNNNNNKLINFGQIRARIYFEEGRKYYTFINAFNLFLLDNWDFVLRYVIN